MIFLKIDLMHEWILFSLNTPSFTPINLTVFMQAARITELSKPFTFNEKP